MFKVLKIDGPNIVTDKGGVCITAFAYADGGKTHAVSLEDWRMMRDLFVALPDLVRLVEEMYADLCGKNAVRGLTKSETDRMQRADELLAALHG